MKPVRADIAPNIFLFTYRTYTLVTYETFSTICAFNYVWSLLYADFLWLVCILTFNLAHSLFNFTILYEWKQIEYEFDSEDQRTASIVNGTFRIGHVQPLDVQYTNNIGRNWKLQSRYFVTTPRLTLRGVPATLSVITEKTVDGNPVLRPYPSWSWHVDPTSCRANRIVSVNKVWVDECNRLWVIDTGLMGPSDMVCSPQILAFDLATDKLIHKHEIPQAVHHNRAVYYGHVAEVLSKENFCVDTWIYAADPSTSSLLVYSLKLNESWQIFDRTFEPSVKWIVYVVAGLKLSTAYGIVNVALSPPGERNRRKLAYHAFANVNQSYVYTDELRNVSFLDNGRGATFHTYHNPRDEQAIVEAYDYRGRLYFSLINGDSIARWDNRTQFGPKNFEIIGRDHLKMQYTTGLKVGYGEQNMEGIWVFSTRLQKWITFGINPNETNFRIFFANITT